MCFTSAWKQAGCQDSNRYIGLWRNGKIIIGKITRFVSLCFHHTHFLFFILFSVIRMDTSSTDRIHSIGVTDFSSESCFSAYPTNDNPHLLAPTNSKNEASFVLSTASHGLTAASLPPALPRKFQKIAKEVYNGQAYATHVQAIGGDVERFSLSKNDCLNPTHDNVTSQCVPDVPTRHEQRFGYIGGRKPQIARHPQCG